MIYYTTVQYCNFLLNHDCSKPVSSIGRRNYCEITVKEKTLLSHEGVCFQMLDFETSKSNSVVSKSNSNIYFFLENYVTFKRAVSHNVLYYQQLSIVYYQVSFYANIYFE